MNCRYIQYGYIKNGIIRTLVKNFGNFYAFVSEGEQRTGVEIEYKEGVSEDGENAIYICDVNHNQGFIIFSKRKTQLTTILNKNPFIEYSKKIGKFTFVLRRTTRKRAEDEFYVICENEGDLGQGIEEMLKVANMINVNGKLFMSKEFISPESVKYDVVNIIYRNLHSDRVIPANFFAKREWNNPVGIKLHDLFTVENYYVTIKYDGVRCLLCLCDLGSFLIFNSEVVRVDEFPSPFTLYDCELTASDNLTLYVFDVLFFRQKDLRNKPFTERVKSVNTSFSHKGEVSISAIAKEYFTKGNFYDRVKEATNLSTKIENDGLILQPSNLAYKNNKTYKWKPVDKLTIDFKIKKLKNGEVSLLVTAPKNLSPSGYVAFEGTKKFPFKGPTRVYNIEDDAIVEMKYDTTRKTFTLDRVRYDKTEPNFLATAKAVWSEIFNPITLETLRGETVKLMIRYNNEIKGCLYSEKNLFSDSILDIGTGRGSDIGRWERSRLKVNICEQNEEMVKEIAKRLVHSKLQYNIIQKKFEKITGEDLSFKPITAISAFYSLTHIAKSNKSLNKFVNKVSEILQKGKFIGIFFDYQRVNELLTEGDYDCKAFTLKSDNDESKIFFDIKHEGALIKSHREYLVNFDLFSKMLGDKGFRLVHTSFTDYHCKLLPKDSCELVRLYRLFVFER